MCYKYAYKLRDLLQYYEENNIKLHKLNKQTKTQTQTCE